MSAKFPRGESKPILNHPSINNAMAKIASQIKSSSPGAGFYLVSWVKHGGW